MSSRAQYLASLKSKSEPVSQVASVTTCNGRLLRELREGLNLTVSEVCEDLDISDPVLYGMERGNYVPSLSTALRVAQFYGVPFEKVWGLKKFPA
jgi:DNA-binding XRE family transcriptional regulator